MIKRTVDVMLAAIGLVASAPLWAVMAVAIKLEDGGLVFFPQDRVGRGGRVFQALKFRSMRPDAEALTGPIQAAEDDPRVTRVGRILRATAMDELPQLWNIFVGDMSFVGPRAQPEKERVKVMGPEQDVYIRDVPGYELRQLVRPGLTGITQFFARRDLPRRHK